MRQGAFVCEYAGELISSAEASSRHRRRLEDGAPNYVLSVLEHRGDGTALRTNLDPVQYGNVGRFINHSCSPNLTTVVVRADSWVPRLAFFCLRDVSVGEELTFSYSNASATSCALNVARHRALMRPCLCGQEMCTGFLPFDVIDEDGGEVDDDDALSFSVKE